jgi:Mg-chelatase subunit ChlD
MGESMVRALSGYDPSFIEKNINIPEFRRELDKKIREKIDDMRRKKLIDRDGNILQKGYRLSALIMYTQELDNLSKGGFLGERPNKKDSIYGEKNNIKNYKSHDRYKDIDIKKSVKTSIRRGHATIEKEDLKVFTREHKSSTQIVYAIDASGSMKGEKIGVSKKAGIALAYKAIERKDKVGIIVFGEDVKERLYPTNDFNEILNVLSMVKAASETNLALTIHEGCKLFLDDKSTKHLMLITDAMPTVGMDPKHEVLAEVANAKAQEVTVSIVGINLDRDGEELAREIINISEGQFHIVKDLKNMDKIILEDYYSFY